VVLLFLASGTSGLVYEVVWMRQLTLVIGHTSFAASIVISAFLGGLSIGSVLGGRLAERAKSPLRTYAALELATGVLSLLLTLLLQRLEHASEVLGAPGGGSPALHVLLTFVLVLPPTVVMGATLPMLTRFVARDASTVGRHFGFLYGTNTLGAALGCALAGFWLIGMHGLFMTAAIASAVNGLVAAAALLLSRTQTSTSTPTPTPTPTSTPTSTSTSTSTLSERARRGMTAAFGLAGFVSISYEILWFRGLGLFLPSTAYAFSALLVVFLVGLVLGAAIYSIALAGRVRDLSVFASSQLLLSFVGLLSMTLLGQSRALSSALTGAGVLGILAQASLVMLVPATIIGVVFPCVVQITTRQIARAGASVGLLYAVNTLGGILGSLVVGFLLIPRLGMQGCFFVLSGASLAVAALVTVVDGAASRRERVRVGIGALVVAAAFVMLPADWLVARYTDAFSGKPLHVVDGRDGLLAVVEYTYESACHSKDNPVECPARCASVPWHHRQLRFGSMSYATTAMTGARYMTSLANLPMLAHPAPHDALVVCFGTGTTAGTFLSYPELERLTIVDINPDVLTSAAFFTEVNHDVAHDPRTHLLVDDGRHHLLATQESYDVISFEPPPPITAGTVSLYTREFYENASARLKKGGLLTQWIPLDEQSDMQNRMLVRAMLDVFADVALFIPARHEAVLVGSREPLAFNLERMRSRAAIPAVERTMHDVGFDSPLALLGTLVSGKEQLRAWAASAAPVTDDLPAVEYPLLRARPVFSVEMLLSARTQPAALLGVPATSDVIAELVRQQDANFTLVRGADDYRDANDEAARAKVTTAVGIAGRNAYTDYLSTLEYDCMFPFR
jgi:spermidine synthase/MFS family permease